MTVAIFAFYLFASVLLTAAVMVISARNPVHSVLWLIVAFFNAAGLFILLGAEFLAMILLIVYVGAVAVLFLFVVMMLDIDFAKLKVGTVRYLPLGLLVGGIILAEILFAIGAWAPGQSTVYDALGAAERADLAARGVCAEVAGAVLDVHGKLLDTSLSERLIGVTGAQLQHVPLVVGVPYGRAKAAAVRASLRSGVVDALVTHSSLALELLALGP